MTIEESPRKQLERKRALGRSERLEQTAEERDLNKKVEDERLQSMIERSIKDHGA